MIRLSKSHSFFAPIRKCEIVSIMRIFTLTLLLSCLCICLSAHTSSQENDESLVSVTVDIIEPVSCFGSADGAIAISVDGGTPPLDYLWSNEETAEDIENLSPGDYKVTVTDATGASVSSPNITVAQPALMSVALNFVQSLTCANADNGAIEVTVYGGTEPFDYIWSHGSTEEDPSNLEMGNYQFTVTDANGCTWDSPTVTVNEPNAIVLYESVSNASTGESNGSIAIDLNGGLPPYNFLWDNGAISTNLENVEAGTYCLTVTDAYDCSLTQCYEVAEEMDVANDKIEGLKDLNIFPNPATNNAILTFELETPQEVKISIVDMAGRKHWSHDAGVVRSREYYLNTKRYAAGVYLIKTMIGGKVATKKLVIK